MRRQTYGSARGLAKIFKIIAELLREISSAFANMPKTMKQLAFVQIFTWLGLFCMWMFFGLTTFYHIFGARNAGDARFALGQEWGGNAFAIYSIVCFVIAFLLPKLAAATSRKTVHAISLICGGVGLLSVYFIQDKSVLLVTMVGVGIAWLQSFRCLTPFCQARCLRLGWVSIWASSTFSLLSRKSSHLCFSDGSFALSLGRTARLHRSTW